MVVAVDEGEDLCTSIGGIDEASILEHLCLERTHEGLCPGVVIGVTACGHALTNGMAFEELTQDGGSILATPVTMED